MAKRYIRVGGGLGWQNAPSTLTPRNAANLNIMDKGIKDCDDAIGDLVLLKTVAKTDLVAAINEQNDNLAGLGAHTGVVIFPSAATGGSYHSSMMPLLSASTKTITITAAIVIGEYALTSGEISLLTVGKRTDGILLSCSDTALAAKIAGKAVSINYTVA